MNEKDIDILLTRPPLAEDDGGDELSHEQLDRYLEDSASEEELAEIEGLLARSEAARLRLESARAEPGQDPLHGWAMQALEHSVAQTRSDNVVSLSSRRRIGTRSVVAGLAAAAAAFAVYVQVPEPEAQKWDHYALEGPFGGVRTERSTMGEAGAFVPSSRLELVLRPEQTVDVRPSFALYERRADGSLVRRDGAGDVTLGDTGGIAFEAEVQRLFGVDYGTKSLVAIVGEASSLPDEAESETSLKEQLGQHAWFATQVKYVPAPED